MVTFTGTEQNKQEKKNMWDDLFVPPPLMVSEDLKFFYGIVGVLVCL